MKLNEKSPRDTKTEGKGAYEWAGVCPAVGWHWPSVQAVPTYLLLLLVDSGHENLNSGSTWSLQPLSHCWYVWRSMRSAGCCLPRNQPGHFTGA